MQFLLDLINIPVPAVSVIPGIDLTLRLDLVSHSIDDFLFLVRSIKLSNLT